MSHIKGKRAPFKPAEGTHRSYNRKLKRDALQSQKDKLPNEFRGCLDDYNYNNVDNIAHIDSNDYGYF